MWTSTVPLPNSSIDGFFNPLAVLLLMATTGARRRIPSRLRKRGIVYKPAKKGQTVNKQINPLLGVFSCIFTIMNLLPEVAFCLTCKIIDCTCLVVFSNWKKKLLINSPSSGITNVRIVLADHDCNQFMMNDWDQKMCKGDLEDFSSRFQSLHHKLQG